MANLASVYGTPGMHTYYTVHKRTDYDVEDLRLDHFVAHWK